MDLITIGGIVLGLGIGAGLNVYGAVAAIGIAARLEWLVLAPGLRGLESPIVIGSALLLYFVEVFANREPGVQRWWNAVHTLVRPLAAASLTAVAVPALGASVPAAVWVAATVAAGIIALLVHASKAGARLLLAVSGDARWNRAVNWCEDAVALAIAPLALARPGDALWVALGMLVALVTFGRWLWRAFLLGPRALAARGSGFFGAKGWVESPDLPAWVTRSLAPHAPGQARNRGTRAALQGAPGRFRNGWLIVGGEGPRFLFRGSSGRVRLVPLFDATCGDVRADAWVDGLPLGSNGTSSTLFLLKDGPDPRAVQRLFQPGPGER
jgi:hypothetical protein